VFPITTQGTTVVTWSFDDGNGQVVTANQNVIIDDITPPVIPTLADVTAECSATPVAPTTTDNCSGTITGTTTTVFPITTQGTTVVTWSFDDGNGQIVTASQNIIIDDVTPPLITAPSAVTIPENGGCVATNVVLGTATATDNCSSVTITNDAPATFPLGTTTVTWTATDLSGNSSTAVQTVFVTDQINPTASLQDITVVLDDAGMADIQFSDIDLGSSDNCGLVSSTLSQTVFDCGDIGLNTITITLTDSQGNSTAATVTVTVKSNGIDTDNDGIDDSCDDSADPTYVKIPEAFTPNGNHINDYFVVGNITAYAERSIEVFNRYGNRVYESKNYNNDWDGTRSDNGQKLADGTYYYVLILNGEVKKGYVYINRVKQ
jgi:gliding motility-associated-like protein